MTSFFDSASRAISALTEEDKTDDERYVQRVQAIERPVIETVLANTSDHEFPDDLRRKVCRTIGTYDYPLTPTTARRVLISVRHSDLISELHSIFHDLARRRAPLRNTTWSDSPTQNLVTVEASDGDDPDREGPEA